MRALQCAVGALVLTNEALELCDVRALGAAVRAQPPWSDLPVIFLAAKSAFREADHVVRELGNVLVIERPTSPDEILAAVTASLRARRRQYAFRDLLLETEQQKTEISCLNERLVRAMRETHHRVKNNLQVVAALVDLRCMDGAENLSLEEFRRIGSHVQTLAVVHDILTAQAKDEATIRQVSAHRIFETLLPKIQVTAPSCAITYEADEVSLTVRQATALSLVLFELLANAVKHGNGQAHVALQTRSGEAELAITDNGPGFPSGFDPAVRAHTGLELVENISRWDLRGSTAYETLPAGGRVRVTFPIHSQP